MAIKSRFIPINFRVSLYLILIPSSAYLCVTDLIQNINLRVTLNSNPSFAAYKDEEKMISNCTDILPISTVQLNSNLTAVAHKYYIK